MVYPLERTLQPRAHLSLPLKSGVLIDPASLNLTQAA